MDDQAKHKWNKIYAGSNVGQQAVSKVLIENHHLLPDKGRALDVACGTGSDAIYLARQGLSVDAWDISDSIIDKLSLHAKSLGLSLVAEARDINERPPEENCYDVICVAHYLERKLIRTLMQGLKPGGLIYYQTFSQIVTQDYSGPKNFDFRLAENELLNLFSELQLVVYREEKLLGDTGLGFRNEVMLVGLKKN